jgi:hypothetical protein
VSYRGGPATRYIRLGGAGGATRVVESDSGRKSPYESTVGKARESERAAPDFSAAVKLYPRGRLRQKANGA